MKFFVIRAKHLVIALAVLVILPLLWLGTSSSTEVFKVGERDLPIYSVEREDHRIALTFDCAWNADDIDQVLAALDQYHAKATFFLVGDWAEKYPDSVVKIKDHGHEIGSHSYKHGDYTKMSEEELLADMKKCDDVIETICGTRPSLMRAPSGGYNNKVVQTCEQSGRMCIQWSIDGLDYPKDATPERIFTRATEKTADGDILLLHNGTAYTAQVLPKILENLSQKFELVTVSDLIYKENYTLDRAGRQSKQ